MKPIALAFLLLALAGCQTAEQKLAAAAPVDDAQCQEMGYKPGTALYLQCRELKIKTHFAAHAEEQARRERIADGLQAAGAALQQAGGSGSGSTIRTSCSRFGNSIDCTSSPG